MPRKRGGTKSLEKKRVTELAGGTIGLDQSINREYVLFSGKEKGEHLWKEKKKKTVLEHRRSPKQQS